MKIRGAVCQKWFRMSGICSSSSFGYTISRSTKYIPQNRTTTNWKEGDLHDYAVNELQLTMPMGIATVVKKMSHAFMNQYLVLLQGMMSVKKQRKKYTNWIHCKGERYHIEIEIPPPTKKYNISPNSSR